MCNCNGNNNLSEVLQVILLLQQNANCSDACLDSCDRATLGCGTTCVLCNTRPLMLYSCSSGSTPLSFPISRAYDETTTSNIFRIEKLDGNTATFRVLTLNEDGTLSATNSFFTMNLGCCCVIRCMNDTYVESI